MPKICRFNFNGECDRADMNVLHCDDAYDKHCCGYAPQECRDCKKLKEEIIKLKKKLEKMKNEY